MGLLKFENIGISAINATVPKKVVKTGDLVGYFTKEQIEKFIDATGVQERRFANPDICASDLCYSAACQIFDKTPISKEDIDMLIFVSQTPDYKTPATSIVLQDRLGLKKSTIVLDINMSCTGFIHGLLTSYTFLGLPEVKNVLLLVGDTLSKMISLQDKSSGMLLGDGAIAAVITKGKQYGNSYFSMNTDGANLDSVLIPAGGCRTMSSVETLTDRIYEDGSIRNQEQVIMNGMDVFSFAISVLPKDVKTLLNYANVSIADIDQFAFHQANKFMTEFIAKKLKVDISKLLSSIHKYGNTAGISIPLTLVENRHLLHDGNMILMNAIGAGFTYGTVLLNIADCQILELNEL